MPRLRVIAFAAASALLTVGTGAVGAQTFDDLFDSGTLQELRINMNSRDLQLLKDTYTENTRYPADLQWHGVKVRNVSVRSRGSGSRNGIKIGFEVEFDRYSASQRFLGMTSLVLDNLVQDPGMVREQVSMRFFQRMGIPTAPRESFCRLYVNDVYFGVYGVVEPIAPELVQRSGADPDSYIFEYHYKGPFYGEYLGSALKPYKSLFEPRSHELESDTMLYGPIRDLFRELNAPDDAVWRERVDAYVDLPEIVTYVAIETFLSEADGILNLDGMSNFYLSRPHDTTQHRFIPWDKDRTFYDVDASVVANVDTNVLMHRALAYPDLKALYLDTLANCARSAADEGWLDQEIARLEAVIASAAAADTLKPFTNDEMATAVSYLRDFAQRRSAIVLDEIARIREASGETGDQPGTIRR
jgi:spore coat protein CotH